MNPFKIRLHYVVIILCLVTAYHLYFIGLVGVAARELIYFDVLVFLGIGSYLLYDFSRTWISMQRKKALMGCDELIYQRLAPYVDEAILKHDLDVLGRQIDDNYAANREKEDEIAKWIHEMKVPLAALGLLAEKVQDPLLRQELQEQKERISQSLASMLVGMRLTSPILDVQIKPVTLSECVRTAIKNNQFFLIRNQFEIHLEGLDEVVYTDKQWLIYVLDQLIANAIKYAKETHVLSFEASYEAHLIHLKVTDQGEGILPQDIHRIFDKGYTGGNQHNGMYKSTGMGLYFVRQILGHLGHTITVESQIGGPTSFILSFDDRRDYFLR